MVPSDFAFTRSFTASYVRRVRRIEPGFARSCSHAEMLTLSPITVYSMRSSVPTVPATTSPRLTPMPTSNAPCLAARRRTPRSAIAWRMSSAVMTALDMRQAIADLGVRRRAARQGAFEVGIGVSLGEVVAGTVGTEERMEYTVIGDSVNISAWLQDRAKPGSILLTRRTYEAVKDLVNAKSLGTMKVKGKKE